MGKDGPPQPWDWLGDLEYEQMRRALIIFFAANGCGALADDLPGEVFQVAEQEPSDRSVVADYEGAPPGIVTLIVLGRKGPHWIPFQAAALALSHTLNASFRNRLNVSLLHK